MRALYPRYNWPVYGQAEQLVLSEIAAACLEAGLVVNGISPTALRLAPPLIVTEAEITQAIDIIDAVLAAPSAADTTAPDTPGGAR